MSKHLSRCVWWTILNCSATTSTSEKQSFWTIRSNLEQFGWILYSANVQNGSGACPYFALWPVQNRSGACLCLLLFAVFMSLHIFPQPLEKLCFSPKEFGVVWGNHPKPRTRFREVLHTDSILKNWGSARFHIKVPLLNVEVPPCST